MAFSNYESIGSILGVTLDVRTVTCHRGYTGGGNIMCQTDGHFEATTCDANPCTPTSVANSNYSSPDSMTGNTEDVLYIQCSDGYSGSGESRCTADGEFESITCTPNPCSSTQVEYSATHSTLNSIFGDTDDWIDVQCLNGYSASNHDQTVPIMENVACRNTFELSESTTDLNDCLNLALADTQNCFKHGNGITVSHSLSSGTCVCSTDSCDDTNDQDGFNTYVTLFFFHTLYSLIPSNQTHKKGTTQANDMVEPHALRPDSLTALRVLPIHVRRYRYPTQTTPFWRV